MTVASKACLLSWPLVGGDEDLITPEYLAIEALEVSVHGIRWTSSEDSREYRVGPEHVVGVLRPSGEDPIVLFCESSSVEEEMDFVVKGVQTAAENLSFPNNYDITLPVLSSRDHGHIILSIKSGQCKAKKVYEALSLVWLFLLYILAHDNSTRPTYQIHETTSEETIKELTRSKFLPDAQQGHRQHIVLFSGDGGLVDILNELFAGGQTQFSHPYEPPIVSLIPLGTGNALANSYKINDGTHGLSSWLRGAPRQLPLMRVDFSHAREGPLLISGGNQQKVKFSNTLWGAVVFSWGFHAQLVADSDTAEYRKHGAKRFGMAAQEALFPADGAGPHAFKGSVTLERWGEHEEKNWEVLSTKTHSYVLCTLVSNLERTFTVSPATQPFDQKLRLVHIKHSSGDEIGRIMGLAYQEGQHVSDNAVSYEVVDRLLVDIDENDSHWRRVCLDGQIILAESAGKVTISREMRNAIQLTSLR